MPSKEGKRWESFDISEVENRRADQDRSFLEFFRAPDMSAGLYVLERNAADRQSPHGEDEIYYVLEGRAVIRVDDEDKPVDAGSVIYVKAGVPHHFHRITERLKILVVFAPAFGSAAGEVK